MRFERSTETEILWEALKWVVVTSSSRERVFARFGSSPRCPLFSSQHQATRTLPNTMVPALPDNVLRHIFSYLTLPKAADLIDTIEDRFGDHVNGHLREPRIQKAQQTLFNVSLASKNFALSAWPALYRAYSSWPLGNRDTIPTYYLRTLCLKPEYGKALRSLAIDAQPPTGASGLDNEDLYELLLGDAMTMALFQWRARNFWLGELSQSTT